MTAPNVQAAILALETALDGLTKEPCTACVGGFYDDDANTPCGACGGGMVLRDLSGARGSVQAALRLLRSP